MCFKESLEAPLNSSGYRRLRNGSVCELTVVCARPGLMGPRVTAAILWRERRLWKDRGGGEERGDCDCHRLILTEAAAAINHFALEKDHTHHKKYSMRFNNISYVS